MSRTRVLLATRLFLPEPGAAPLRLGALVRALQRQGAEVEVLTSRPPSGAGPVDAALADRVRRWPVLRDRNRQVRGYLQYASFDVPLVVRLLLARRPGAVVVEPPPTTGAVVRVVTALRRVPYAYYAADLLTPAAEGAGAPALVVALLRRLEGWALRGASAVLTFSPDMVERLGDFGVLPERVVVVGTGADTTVLTPRAPAGEVPPPPARTLVYAGTMSEMHGAEVFVEAMPAVLAAVPDARLVMLGTGTARGALQRRAQELAPGHVDLPGVVPVAEVARHMRAARAGLASKRAASSYEFGFAVKVFATTACGTPVVYAGDGPCVPLVRDNRLGWTAPWEVAAVAEAMVAALQHEPSAEERERIAGWTRREASLETVAARGAAAVLGLTGAPGSAASG